MRRQSVRVSQMVLTLGPGAILESREGPRIILRDGLQMPSSLSLENLRLFSPELENLLPRLLGIGDGPVYIFQVPGSGIADARWRTRPFPEWHLCVRHQKLYRNRCPDCVREGEDSRRWRRKEAIRFVRACPAGHLDDVDWHRLVHRRNPPHQPNYYRWETTGPGLADIRIVCPVCNSSRFLGEAYGEPQVCSGRFPERESPEQPPVRPGCSEQAYILQRQASNLRIPEVVSLFTVPPLFTSAHLTIRKLVQRLTPGVTRVTLLTHSGGFQRETFRNLLDELVSEGYLKASERDDLLGLPDGEIVRVLKDVLEYTPPSDLAVLLGQEFLAFLKGAREGIPPVRDPVFHSRILLEVRPGLVRRYPPFLVVPVTRLRLVTVQTGYRRSAGPVLERGNRPALVDVSIRDQKGNRWFPGYESVGEGLFVTLLDTNDEGWTQLLNAASGRSGEWMRAYQNSDGYDRGLFRDPDLRAELHPGFVTWHTFSHLLIRALSVDSGYSAPSIRERIYFEEKDDGSVRGGVLIYTTSRGGDGSLGGLLMVAAMFDRVLKRVREMARSCSADPLCRDYPFRPGISVLGAACHACCLVSETSCEHRNHWLDRTVLVETGWLEY